MNPAWQNPFKSDVDRFEIWEMLMRRDFEAFLAADWTAIRDDFVEEEFQGLDAGKVSDPDQWHLRFSDLNRYQAEWLKQARAFQAVTLIGVGKLDFLFDAVALREIEIDGSRALARKKFTGRALTTVGEPVTLLWQTLYFLRKCDRWKITGFVGYLPLRAA